MKVIFLDFDGVLNSQEYIESRLDEFKGKKVGLDIRAVRRLNSLVMHSGAEIVVSSTWRQRRTRQDLNQVLRDAGFYGEILGMTPTNVNRLPDGSFSSERRGQEIQAWLDAAPRYGIDVDSFVIIDDDSDMAHLKHRLIQTTYATGLLDVHVTQACNMLAST